MADERVVYAQTVEALVRHILPPPQQRALQPQLKAMGIDLSRPLEVQYSLVEVWDRAALLAANTLFPGRSREDALHELGARFIEAFHHTLAGKAVIALGKVVGAEASIRRLEKIFRSGNNFTKVTVKKLGPGLFEVEMNEPHHSQTYVQGLLSRGLKLLGVERGEVTFLERQPQSCTFRIALGG